MNARILHVFAVNEGGDTRHTHLTRARGEVPDLPPLAEWLGVETLDTDRIELFPVKDLDDVKLSDYVTMAFDPVTPPDAAQRARLDALGGSVLLVPDAALDGAPAPGRALTEIAALPLAQPDNSADLPKADVGRPERAAGTVAAPQPPARKAVSPALIIGVAVALLVILLFGLAG